MDKNELYNEIAEVIVMRLRKVDFIKLNDLIASFPEHKNSDIEFAIKELKIHGVLKEMPLGLFIATKQINLKSIFQDSDLSSDPSSLLIKALQSIKRLPHNPIAIIIGVASSISSIIYFILWILGKS